MFICRQCNIVIDRPKKQRDIVGAGGLCPAGHNVESDSFWRNFWTGLWISLANIATWPAIVMFVAPTYAAATRRIGLSIIALGIIIGIVDAVLNRRKPKPYPASRLSNFGLSLAVGATTVLVAAIAVAGF